MVELTTSLLLDEYINPTCISNDQEPVGTNCQIVGWTKNADGKWKVEVAQRNGFIFLKLEIKKSNFELKAELTEH